MRPRFARRACLACARGLRSAWLVLGLTLGLLLILESLLRVGFAIKDAVAPLPEPDPRVVAEGYAGASWVTALYREQAAVRTEWRPYVTHRARPFTGTHVTVSADGLRRSVLPPDVPADAPLVWLAGGSVAWGMGARDQATIASRLAARMAALGRPVRVVNRAQIGYVQTQELAEILLALRSGERPDAIVFLDGVNDVLSAYQNGTAGWPQNEANRVAEFNLRDDPPRLATALLGALVRKSALSRLARSIALRLRASPSPPIAAAPWSTNYADAIAATTAANLRFLDNLARQLDVSVVVAWQPILFSKRSMTDYERTKAVEYAWLQEPIDQTLERLSRLELPAGRLRTLDLSHLLDDLSALVFTDFCHLTETGQDHVAQALADALATSWDIPPRRAPEPMRPDRGP